MSVDQIVPAHRTLGLSFEIILIHRSSNLIQLIHLISIREFVKKNNKQ